MGQGLEAERDGRRPMNGSADAKKCCGLPVNTLDVFGVRLYQCSYRSHHPMIFRNLNTGEEVAESYDGGRDGGLRWTSHYDDDELPE